MFISEAFEYEFWTEFLLMGEGEFADVLIYKERWVKERNKTNDS
jgi:hypothetical protein